MKLSGLAKMVKLEEVCNVYYDGEMGDDLYIGTMTAIYCATGFPRPLSRSQIGAMLGISEKTMNDNVIYNDNDWLCKNDTEGFDLSDNTGDEVCVRELGIDIKCFGETFVPLVTEDESSIGFIRWTQLAPVEDEIKNSGYIRYFKRKKADGSDYYVVKNGMRLRAVIMPFKLDEKTEAKLQSLVAMLADAKADEPQKEESPLDALDEAEDEE